MVVGTEAKSCPLWKSHILATTLQGLICRLDCLHGVESSCGVSLNLLDSDKWLLLWLTGVEGKLILVRLSLDGLDIIVEAEWLCSTLSVLQWYSVIVGLYLTGNLGCVLFFGLAREKPSEPGTLMERFEPLVEEQSDACWWGTETGIWYPGLEMCSSSSWVSAVGVTEKEAFTVPVGVKSTVQSVGSGVGWTDSESISSTGLSSLKEGDLDGCSCFWNSKSCPMKWRLGEMQGRRSLIKS